MAAFHPCAGCDRFRCSHTTCQNQLSNEAKKKKLFHIVSVAGINEEYIIQLPSPWTSSFNWYNISFNALIHSISIVYMLKKDGKSVFNIFIYWLVQFERYICSLSNLLFVIFHCWWFRLSFVQGKQVFRHLQTPHTHAMTVWSNVRKLAAVAIGASTGVGTYLYLNRVKDSPIVYNSWTTNTVVPPEAKWDFNWDQ